MKIKSRLCAALALSALAWPASEAQSLTARTPSIAAQPSPAFDTIDSRIAGRDFPSVFAPWAVAENLLTPDGRSVPLSNTESPLAVKARHDLYFTGWNGLGLKLVPGLQYVALTPVFTPESIDLARANRAKLLAMNPHMLILSEVRYYNAPRGYLPPDSPWWAANDQSGSKKDEYGLSRLDFSSPDFQDRVAALCGALLRTGIYDGCMLDWWHDDAPMGKDRLTLIRKIRAAVGDKAVLIGNVNNRLPARTASDLNGMYMEGFGSRFFPDWRTAAVNLIWGEHHLRKPAITALEGWYACPTPDCTGDPAVLQQQGRADQARMRAVTTLALVFSNGYALFSDPNQLPTPDHLHDWYPFWDKSLGKAVGSIDDPERPDLSGAFTRRFEKGEAVFNPPDNHEVMIKFSSPMRSAATNQTGRSFTVPAGDGDLFFAAKG